MKSYQPVKHERYTHWSGIRYWIRCILAWANETEVRYECLPCHRKKYYVVIRPGDSYCHCCRSKIDWKELEA